MLFELMPLQFYQLDFISSSMFRIVFRIDSFEGVRNFLLAILRA